MNRTGANGVCDPSCHVSLAIYEVVRIMPPMLRFDTSAATFALHSG